MRAFDAGASGDLLAEFEVQEVVVFTDLVQQIIGLLERVKQGEADVDPGVLARLFPDAYVNDPEAADEFRRFTLDDLIDRKVENARGVLVSFENARSRLTGDGEVRTVQLDREYAMYWLGTLTDLRLVLATSLGIDGSGNTSEETDSEYVESLYDWFGFAQGSLLEALEEAEGIT
ncbi:hypothetical protein IWX78_001650 [Mycetocola sp. CAN_C7]|uniref:DUF2017 family protein n=1 Tax=Mycetocola sp. CAN_C7 TaxID=2787724 RepID=UPI0018CAB65F